MRLIDADQFGVVSFQGKSENLIENEDFIKGVLFILDKIYEAPTVERPHGEWICKGSVGNGTWCSVCDINIKLFPNRYSFCPNCGSDNRPRKHGCSFADEECKNNPCKDCGLREGE